MSKKQHHKNKWMPAVYVSYYGILINIAKKHGYALGIHGSVTRDFDLIAVPWVDNPSSHIVFLQDIKNMVGIEQVTELPYDSVEEKPKGRMAYTIPTGGGGYLDISIF